MSATKERTWEQIQAEDLTLCAKEPRGDSMITAQEFRDAAEKETGRSVLYSNSGRVAVIHGTPIYIIHAENARLLLAAAEQAEQLEMAKDALTAQCGVSHGLREQIATLTARVAELEARITEAHELDYRRVQHIRELSTLITAWEAKAAK